MDYFWKENKKYVIAVAGGVVAAILYWSFVIAPIRKDADGLVKKLRDEHRALQENMAKGVPTPETLDLARRDVERARQQLTAFREDLAFKEGERFQAPKKEVKAHLDNVKLDLYKELKDKAKALNAFPPQANFDMTAAGDEVSEDLARELLLRLALVERLVLLAIDCKVDKIEKVDALYGVSEKSEPVTKKGVFLNKYSVSMSIRGEAMSIFKFVHGVQKKGEYLAVSHFEFTRDDPTKDYFGAMVAVTLLKADDKLPIEPEKPSEGGE
jgi:hypothetical protein